ncbi:hypothetical protein DPMN_137801 [Dreissena polymorpha]|uniref:DUF6589 domain-containing protein n=2 Tax=Dreissena polymorpha TaxID=45954 RepID=A0A9D4G8K1_DREPO|nr:hypothetical protein DPMN_137801 [Dreissena polymorpha]
MVPVGGDQLTRVRLDGAKSLRAGAHTRAERFENLCPVLVEMFHMQMDFLEKTIMKFFKKSSGRDVGTLSNIKIHIQRTNVNGNVKSRFKAHEDFVLLVGKAYIQEAAVEYFGMQDFESSPTRNIPDGDISRSHLPKRLQEFNKTMDGLMNLLCGPLSFDEVGNNAKVPVMIGGHCVELPVQNGNIVVSVQLRGQLSKITIPLKMVQNHSHVNIVVGETPLQLSLVKEDQLQNYILNFLQYYFVMLNLKDSIREGDIFRLSNNLKMTMPFFFSHSNMSKYFVECIDYILKTEIVMPPKLAIQARTAAFVNRKGKPGKNKAADMEKENQVKDIKDLIRGLGANKTEKSIVKVTAAAPVIKNIVSNVDNQIGFVDKTSAHKKRSKIDDMRTVSKILRKVRPLHKEHGRKVDSSINMQASVCVELRCKHSAFIEQVVSTALRLQRGFPMPVENEELNED